MPLNAVDRSILQYALQHLETEKARLEALISDINRQLFGTSVSAPTESTPSESAPVAKTKKATRKKKSGMSAEAKARMADGQKKRWELFHAKQKETTDMLAKLERRAKKAAKKVTKKAVKKAAKKTATKKKTDSDIPF